MLNLLLGIDPNWALVLATIPPAIYLGLSFYLKADHQVTLAAVLSVIYALIMLITILTVISTYSHLPTSPPLSTPPRSPGIRSDLRSDLIPSGYVYILLYITSLYIY